MHSDKRALSIPGPHDIMRHELANGLVVLVRENPTSASAVVRGYVRAGALDEPRDRAGLAGFAASLLMRGTRSRGFEQINESVEGLGASLGVSGGRHVTSLHAKCLAEDLDAVLDVLADVLRDPIFPVEQVENVRGLWLTDLQERDHDTRRVAALTFREVLYPDHPYGRSLIGYRETAQMISRDEVAGFYGQHYGPAGAVIVIVGAIEAKSAVALAEKHLAGWEGENGRHALPAPAFAALEQVWRRDTVVAGKTQSDIVLGWRGPRRSDTQYYTARLANTVLGRFGMYGRLGVSVRERQGLAYYCLSTLDAGMWPGPWYAFAGVNPANVDQAVISILGEIVRLREELVPEDELDDSKALLTGSLPLQLETNEGVAGTIVQMERHGLGLDYLQRYPDLIRQISARQVQEVAAKYLDPSAYALAIAGPERVPGLERG